MCQAINDGGRRCPIHQHQNVAFIKGAAALSGLNKHQTERLFAELRREGRNSTIDETTADTSALLVQLLNSNQLPDAYADVDAEFAKADIHNQDIDSASKYAQHIVVSRARIRSANVDARFQQIADRTGLSKPEVAEKFKEFYEAVDTSRNAEVPEEYNQNTRRAAVIADLPYDKASVVAFEKLNNLNEVATERRVAHVPIHSTQIQSAGFDDGRLEVKMTDDRVNAYQNVPESVWERLRDSPRPGSIYARQIRGNEDYQYDSESAAEADAYAVRCASCGQFRAVSHSCPERAIREALTNDGVTATIIGETLVAVRESVRMEDEVTAPEEPEPLVVSEPEPEVPVEEDVPVVSEPETVIAIPSLPAIEAKGLFEEHNTPETDTERYPHFLGYDAMGQISSANGDDGSQVDSAPTKETQENPTSWDFATALKVGEELGYKDVTIANSTNISYSYFSGGTISEEDKALIEAAPAHINFIFGKKASDERPQIVKSYDDRFYTAKSIYNYSTGTLDRGYHLRARGWQAPKLSYTVEEMREETTAASNLLQPYVDSGEAVVVPDTVTETRKYTFDKNLTEQPKIRVGNSAVFKKAIRENKVGVLPVSVRITSSLYDNQYVDDQGYELTANNDTIISGKVALRRNADGVMEAVTNERTLKCNCRDYREKYYCQHINYVQRHIGNVAQQMLPVQSSSSTATADPNRHRLLTQGLVNREDVSIIAGVDGEPDSVSFGTEVTRYNKKSEYGYEYLHRLHLPARLKPVDPDNITPDEALAMLNYRDLISDTHELSLPKSPSQIRAAIKRSDVQVPLSTTFSRWGAAHRGAGVTGAVILNRETTGDLENVTIKSHTLKCGCAEYQENYDCQHVRFTVDQTYAYLTMGSSNTIAETDSWKDASDKHRVAMEEERELASYVNTGMTREAARQQIREEQEARVRAEEERQARYAREQEERLERRRQQQQEMFERQRTLNVDTIANAETYRSNMLDRWNNVEDGSYTDNPEQFYDDYKAALSRKRAGGEAVEFKTENVTDGICADAPGARQFGVELEFDIKSGVNRSEALRKIGQELHDAGLTEQAQQTGYHSARASGWGSWSFEEDCTVHAELVSPIMKDTPEDWEQLRKATEIINRNGGVATTRTGSHVHISTASYEDNSAKHVELLRTVNQNDDLMYRLASNPATGKHRGTYWCSPNVNDGEDDVEGGTDPRRILSGHSSHGVAMNFEGTAQNEYKKSNIEFRMWDGTLDPAVIQQQVAISAAITDYAERNVIANDGTSKKPTERRVTIGTNKPLDSAALDGGRTHNKESFEATSGQAAVFFDKIFRTKATRAAAASLFAVTNWQES